MDVKVLIKRVYSHDGHSQAVSNENPRRYENMLVIADALAKLPPLQHSIMEMWALGFTHETIAKRFGTSRTTVGSKIQKSIDLLKEELEGVL